MSKRSNTERKITITVRFWVRLGSFEPDYNKRIEKKFIGKIKAKSDYPLKTPCFTAFQKG